MLRVGLFFSFQNFSKLGLIATATGRDTIMALTSISKKLDQGHLLRRMLHLMPRIFLDVPQFCSFPPISGSSSF
jgi:hypothetical protein